MTRTISRVVPAIAVACCVLAGCNRADEQPEPAPMAVDSLSGDSVFDPSADRVTLPSSRIYYALTNHEWYARGQPLLHEGRPYEPEGMPVDASLSDMEKLGEFQGVEYYSRNGDGEPVVYVPVFDGYWQRFRADPSAAAAVDPNAGTAPDSTPDGD